MKGAKETRCLGRLGAGIASILVLAAAGCSSGRETSGDDLATTEDAIVGNTTAPQLAFPWMARISWKVDGSWTFACGGSLIAPDWVLTAAHCVSAFDANGTLVKQANADVQVSIGDYNLLVTESTEQIRTPTNIVVHPGYVPAVDENGLPVKEFNDIALIELSSPVTLGNFARVVKLASEGDVPGTATQLSGWGEDTEATPKINAVPTDLLQQLDATIVDPANTSDPSGGCNQRMSDEKISLSSQRIPDPKTEICTLNYESGEPYVGYQSACYYDSGSPWVLYNDGCAEQVGVHTFGDLFCVSYDIATRVSAYLPWIRQQGVDYVGDKVYEAEDMFHATGGTHPDGWNIWDNGYISFDHTFNGGEQQMTIRAEGSSVNGVWPRMRVSVGGSNVYEVDVASASWQDYTFTFAAPFGSREVQIRFLNDYYQGGQDRNLFIDKAKVKDTRTSCGFLDTIVPALRITNDWGTGYCAEIDIKNTIAADTVSWTVVYDTKDSTLTQSWNPVVESGQGPHTAVPGNGPSDTWLRVIPFDQVRTLGFCAERAPGTSTLPEVVSAHATY